MEGGFELTSKVNRSTSLIFRAFIEEQFNQVIKLNFSGTLKIVQQMTDISHNYVHKFHVLIIITVQKETC